MHPKISELEVSGWVSMLPPPTPSVLLHELRDDLFLGGGCWLRFPEQILDVHGLNIQGRQKEVEFAFFAF